MAVAIGTVTGVQFFSGANLIGIATSELLFGIACHTAAIAAGRMAGT